LHVGQRVTDREGLEAIVTESSSRIVISSSRNSGNGRSSTDCSGRQIF
jgi:hypothetical protein